MAQNPEKTYKSGYRAFEKGDYGKAIQLATDCLNTAEIDSYWYPGALALRCWAANYGGNAEQVIRDAYMLMSIDSGDDKMWFDGTALLNLGLLRRHNGDVSEAEILFQFASERFAAHRIADDQPTEWALIRDLFVASCSWAAANGVDKIDELAARLAKQPTPKSKIGPIRVAAELYRHAAAGADVRDDAEKATGEGVSRALVALLLL